MIQISEKSEASELKQIKMSKSNSNNDSISRSKRLASFSGSAGGSIKKIPLRAKDSSKFDKLEKYTQ